MTDVLIASRVKESSTTQGGGAYDLDGAQSGGFQTFASAFNSGDLVGFAATDGTDWEVGEGTLTTGTPDTLARTTIHASSNGGSAVVWGPGTKDVFCTFPAERSVVLDSAGKVGAITFAASATVEGVFTATGQMTLDGAFTFSSTGVFAGNVDFSTGFSLASAAPVSSRGFDLMQATETGVVFGDSGAPINLLGSTLIMTSADNIDLSTDFLVGWHSSAVGLRQFPAQLLGFPVSTEMVFHQATAPTGWTKKSANDNSALRVTASTALNEGGSVGFLTALGTGASTQAHTLVTAEMPAHTHNEECDAAGGSAGRARPSTSTGTTNKATSSTGSGNSHQHGIDIDVQYADVIIAAKDA